MFFFIKNILLHTFIIFFILLNFSKAEIINQINIYGNNRISDETIIMFSKLNISDNINETELNRALIDLYETNFFKNVSLALKNNILLINVEENPIIENISYNGISSNRLKQEVLSNVMLKSRSSFNEILLENDKNSILISLRKLGYFFSKVDVFVENLDDNKVDVNFLIELGDKSKIKKITFLGEKVFKDNKLKNVIISEEFKFWKFISSKKYLNEDIISLDTRLLKNFYLNNGYYNVEINSSFAKLIDDEAFELVFNINPNEKLYFDELKIILPTDFDKNHFNSLNDLFAKFKGKPYSLFRIEKILDEIDKITLNEEYVSINAFVRENIINNNINIEFIIEETDKKYISKINILGNNITKENVIRNQFEIDEGDPYNEILFNKSINNLKSLNFFKNVSSNIKTNDNGDNEIDIIVEEKPTGEIMAGAGFGTSGGSFIFGIKENNYLGKGINLNTNLSVSESSLKGVFSVSNPNLFNTDKSGYASIQAQETDKLSEFGYKSNKTGFTFGTGFEYLEDLDLNLGISSFYEVIDTNSSASARQKKQAGNFFDTFLKIDFDYDKRNQKFQTSEGFRSYYSTDLPVISETNTLINSYNFEIFNELYENNITSFSILLESALSLNGKDIKLSERLFVPGSKLRGFELGKIGPKDSNDFIGGNYLTAVNINTTLPQIFPNSQNTDFVIFFDAANVWGVDYNSALDKNSKIRSSLGFGIDWFTPIGPLNFSISQPLTKNSSDITETFRFNLGTSF